jgi:hypothetical protein
MVLRANHSEVLVVLLSGIMPVPMDRLAHFGKPLRLRKSLTTDSRFSILLSRVHDLVCKAQHLLHGDRGFEECDDSHAKRHGPPLILRQGYTDISKPSNNQLRHLGIGLRKKNAKFVTSKSSQKIRLPDLLMNALGQRTQKSISRCMAKAIVDHLKIVKIDIDDGKWVAISLGPADFRLRRLNKGSPVWHPG